MPGCPPTRIAIAAALLCTAPLFAQFKPSAATPTALPPTPPTAAYQPPVTPAQRPPNHAQVAYSNGILSIDADNASLNQILHQVSEESGMKITGGVSDERVFGKYGPGTPAQVIGDLLDGASSNVLFVQSDGSEPAELVLTPRNGGPTPPNPNAAIFREQREEEERRAQSAEPPASEPFPNHSVPIHPAADSNDPNQQQSPNGTRTPQQIFEQLQHMRQQQQQQTSPQ